MVVMQRNSLPGVVSFSFDARDDKSTASEKRPLCALLTIDTWPVTFLIRRHFPAGVWWAGVGGVKGAARIPGMPPLLSLILTTQCLVAGL